MDYETFAELEMSLDKLRMSILVGGSPDGKYSEVDYELENPKQAAAHYYQAMAYLDLATQAMKLAELAVTPAARKAAKRMEKQS